MNKSFKKYKCEYRKTRFARKAIGKIMLAKRAMAAAASAFGAFHMKTIMASQGASVFAKKLAVAECAVRTQLSTVQAFNRVPMPKWYKAP